MYKFQSCHPSGYCSITIRICFCEIFDVTNEHKRIVDNVQDFLKNFYIEGTAFDEKKEPCMNVLCCCRHNCTQNKETLSGL